MFLVLLIIHEYYCSKSKILLQINQLRYLIHESFFYLKVILPTKRAHITHPIYFNDPSKQSEDLTNSIAIDELRKSSRRFKRQIMMSASENELDSVNLHQNYAEINVDVDDYNPQTSETRVRKVRANPERIALASWTQPTLSSEPIANELDSDNNGSLNGDQSGIYFVCITTNCSELVSIQSQALIDHDDASSNKATANLMSSTFYADLTSGRQSKRNNASNSKRSRHVR